MPNPPAPWEAEDAFPIKPVGSDYGYLTGRGPHACTHEDLIARFSRRWRPRLVWTPESDRLVPPADVASLRPLLHQRQIRRARFVGVLAGILCVLHLPPLLTLRGEKLAVIAAELVLLGFIPFIWASRRLSVLRSTDPAEAPLARRNARFAAWLWGRRPVASCGFLACLGVTGVLQIVFGSDRVMDAAGFDRTMVKAGDWWRLITGSLVHIN